MGRTTLLVAFTVLLAGCAGAVSSNGAETVTPAPVPTDEFRYPPGVTSERVVPSTLTAAHVGALATTNYTLTTRQVIRTDDGRLILRTNRTRTVAQNSNAYDGRVYIETSLFDNRRVSNIEFWSNGSAVVTRYTTGDPDREPEVRQWAVQSERPITDLADGYYVEGTLAGGEVTSVRRTPDGGALLVGSGIRDRDALVVPVIVTEPRNLSYQMRVRFDGVVLATRVTYDGTYDDEPVRVERVMRVTDIGTSTVERPAWTENGTSTQGYTGYG